MTAPTATDELQGHRTALRRERDTWRKLFAPPPRLTVSEWADQYRVLSPEASAEPGRWRSLAFQRGIMDAVHEPGISRVCAMLPSQVGKTEICLNIFGFYADAEPSPMLFVEPTIEMARTISKDRIGPMIRDTPKLRGKFPTSGRREADQTILHKSFPGGHLTLVGANSPSGLAMRPIRVVLLDEVDRYPQSAGDEGDVPSLAIRRTTTFGHRRVVFLVGTPTIEGISRIHEEYEASDQRRFLVPCPACGHAQALVWTQLKWDSGAPETASYACEDCGVLIPETDKHRMCEQGTWVPTFPGRSVAGFTATALISRMVSWAELVREWLEAQGNPERLKVFVNTVLAEVWRETGDELNPSVLAARRTDYPVIPDGVGLITAFVDVQADRLECKAVGWGADDESWILAVEQIFGDPTKPEVWDRADVWLDQTWVHPRGATVGIGAAGVDSGYLTPEVYDFVRRRRGKRTFATKGVGGFGRALIGYAKAPKGGVAVFPIGVDTAKDLLFARLKITARGPGYIHLPPWYHDELLAQLTAEKAMTRFVKGRSVREYVKTRPRNEMLDLMVGNMAVLHMLGKVREQLAKRAETFGAPAAETAETPAALADAFADYRPRRGRGGGFATRW